MSEKTEKKKTKTIKVDYLARVEGEGALYLKIRDNRVIDSKFKIFEPPRFFEAFLRERKFSEAPDITARICGICPIAYQMSAVHAMETALGIHITEPVRELRRLVYCGEWIESHALHVYMLHAPDFLGYQDAIRMAKDHPDAVKRGLQLKKVGNEIVELMGGRAIHPVNVRVGGFYRMPRKTEFNELRERLNWARDAAIETVRWVATLPFPEFEQDYDFVALGPESEYPFNEGPIISNRGLRISPDQFEDHFEEEHVEHSNALHCRLKEHGAYLAGPLARVNLNFDLLPRSVRQLAKEVGFEIPCKNPFKSIIARSLEILFCCEEAIRIIDAYRSPEEPAATIQPKAGVGYGCTEAPRGLLYHRYEVGADGLIRSAKIVPPTSQNQRRIEQDLRSFVEKKLQQDPNLEKEKLTWDCEQMIRNYDPCISCATHFLKLDVERC